MMDAEPGTVNNELRQDYIPTNNTPSSPVLCLQSPYHEGAGGQGECLCVPRIILGGLLEEESLKQRLEFRICQVKKKAGYTRQRRVLWEQGEVSRHLGHEI